jgi:hypothetical protein
MARYFDDASSEYLMNASTPITGPPFAISAWLYADDVGNIYMVGVSLGDTGSGDVWQLAMQGFIAGDPLQFNVVVGGSDDNARTTTGVTVNTWHHAIAIEASSTDRRILIDGGSKATNATDLSPSSIDRIGIGVSANDAVTNTWSGAIAEVGLWDLSSWPGATGSDKANNFEAAAVPSLAAGYSPMFYPLGLEAYWSLKIRIELGATI